MRRMLKCMLIMTLASSCLFMSACTRERKNRNEPEIVANLYDNSWIMENYMDALQDYDHCVYEEVYYDWGGRSIGPTDYRFRGVIYLTDEEADRLTEEYEWEETDAPEYEFEKIDTETLGEGPWYTCDQFIADNYPTVDLHYSVFDGERIVFDFTQY